ncbi:MAG TPA: hypothetical protein VFO21_09590 [Vicinamibacterales bacterium]|nr:hypothetical protein [Vicinamibacterales bacterium]
MKRVLIMVLSLLAVSTSVLAQGRGAPAPPPALEPGASQADVDKAVLAAPAQLRNQATVIKWNPSDWSYTTLRKGTNRLVCFDSSGFPGQDPFSVECSSMGNLDRIKQNLMFEAEPDRAKRQAAIAAAEKDGTRPKPEYGSVWYHSWGKDQASARSHMTVAVPGATAQSLGLPDNGKMGGVWVMDAGTSAAHLMIPGF